MRILVTGAPGIGKTTVCNSIAHQLGSDVVGFYTEEVRFGGKRIGFDIVTLGSESKRGVLARTNSNVKGTVHEVFKVSH